MTNMLYAAPGAKVITIYNGHFVNGGGELYLDALAQACSHQFESLYGVPVQALEGERLIDTDIHVDLESVRALIE
jgi:hypothetical protein